LAFVGAVSLRAHLILISQKQLFFVLGFQEDARNMNLLSDPGAFTEHKAAGFT
jgi:hypothetical protein